MDDRLLRDYFFDASLRPDEIASLLNCYKSHLYFALKHERRRPDAWLGFAFLDSTCFTASVEDSELIHLGAMDASRNFLDGDFGFASESMFEVSTHEACDRRGAQSVLESMLDAGRSVLVHTQTSRIPSFISYEGADAPVRDRGSAVRHFFLAIAHDAEDVYFVDTPTFLDPRRHRPFPRNASVSIVDKHALGRAFDAFVTLSCVEVADAHVDLLCSERALFRALADFAVDFRRPRQRCARGVRVHGDEAYQLVIEAFTSGACPLDRSIDACAFYELPNLCTLLDWQSNKLRNQRRLFAAALSHVVGMDDGRRLWLGARFESSASAWQRLERAVCVSPERAASPELADVVAELLGECRRIDAEIADALTSTDSIVRSRG